MKKIILIPNSLEQIKQIDDLVDGYIIPLKDLSANYEYYFSFKELEEILTITKKEIFISLNKNMHSSDIELLKETLLELEKLNIEGILYYDIALVNIKQELNLRKELVWSQEHLTTNYTTCNFWYDEGVKYAYLSSEITLDEIKEIKNNTKMSLFVNIFGYTPMFTSLRPLINNYLETFEISDNSKIHYMEKENKYYPITSDKTTTIYSSNILNGLKEYLELDVDYFVINSFLISEQLEEVLKMFKEANTNNLEENEKQLNNMFTNLDKGFFYLETIYKVIK